MHHKTFVSHLECSRTGEKVPAGALANLSPAGAPLLVRYDLPAARSQADRDAVERGARSLWRYAPLLPLRDPRNLVTLGEGLTPLLETPRLGERIGSRNLLIKDESANPTGTFKARGMAVAVSMAKELGARKLAAPSAGNAAGALAAYAARAGLEAHLFLPVDVPRANAIECEAMGAHVTLVDGLISDCGRIVAERRESEGWFEVSTLKEPYRIEGKKTMGFELAEQLGWRVPDAIFYPTGGGVGLIGMWKAFAELEEMGWIGSKRPRMIAVQASGCAPIVRAWEAGEIESRHWENASTVASGLRVPKALGDFLVLEALRQSRGTALSIDDQETLDAGLLLAESEGLFVAPEGATCVAAARRLLRDGFLSRDDELLIYNTGTGLKYLEAWETRCTPRTTARERLGGLIVPR
ncbi:MAG: threonine synthase [Bryobacterales bacterium]|nr:threonine synthase [Bryobacterales bacterium]